MAIKQIDKETFYSVKPSDKKALFLNDIREIYVNNIEYCELLDFPYSKKSVLNDVARYARAFLAGEYCKLTGKRIKSYDSIPFIMTKVTDENKDIHIYCAFNVNAWNRMIKEAKENEN